VILASSLAHELRTRHHVRIDLAACPIRHTTDQLHDSTQTDLAYDEQIEIAIRPGRPRRNRAEHERQLDTRVLQCFLEQHPYAGGLLHETSNLWEQRVGAVRAVVDAVPIGAEFNETNVNKLAQLLLNRANRKA
jgi:hypothetical protein